MFRQDGTIELKFHELGRIKVAKLKVYGHNVQKILDSDATLNFQSYMLFDRFYVVTKETERD